MYKEAVVFRSKGYCEECAGGTTHRIEVCEQLLRHQRSLEDRLRDGCGCGLGTGDRYSTDLSHRVATKEAYLTFSSIVDRRAPEHTDALKPAKQQPHVVGRSNFGQTWRCWAYSFGARCWAYVFVLFCLDVSGVAGLHVHWLDCSMGA